MKKDFLESSEIILRRLFLFRFLVLGVFFVGGVCGPFLWEHGWKLFEERPGFYFQNRVGILGTILAMTGWIPLVGAWKLGPICRREHLIACGMFLVFLGYEAQFRVFAYCLPSGC